MPYDNPNRAPVGDHITMKDTVPPPAGEGFECSCGRSFTSAKSLKGHKTKLGH